MFWCELPSFGDIGCRDFCLFSNIMGVNGALIVVVHLKNLAVMSLSRNQDLVIQNNNCETFYVVKKAKVCGLFCVTGSSSLERDITDEFF